MGCFLGPAKVDQALGLAAAVHMYPVATKQAFFRAVVAKLEPLGIRPQDALISLTENGYEDWYAGNL